MDLNINERLVVRHVGQNPHFRSMLAKFGEEVVKITDWKQEDDQELLRERLTQLTGKVTQFLKLFRG